jgi:hypothetical protein
MVVTAMHHQQRKQAIRAFSGLVGRYDPEAASPAPNTNGPGRPRLHGNNAAKQKAYRARLADPERRSLVAWLLKKSRTVLDGRQYQRKLHGELILLSVIDLRRSVAVLKENLDACGRITNERSGERERLNGMSEIERLIAQKNQRENGSNVSVKSPSILKAPQSDAARDAAIRDLLNEIYVDQRCPWCDTKFDTPSAAENHLNDEYNRGKRQVDHVKTLRTSNLVPSELLEEAERRLSNEAHYIGISERVLRLRKRHAQWQREGKRQLDGSGAYITWDLRTW